MSVCEDECVSVYMYEGESVWVCVCIYYMCACVIPMSVYVCEYVRG